MHVEHVMGTAVRFDTGDSADERPLAEAIEWLHWVDQTFSVHRPDSQIMRLRTGAITETDVHSEVVGVLDRCMALRILTDGHFDHRPETSLDPSGYVKGWAVQRAMNILEAPGPARRCIDAGGDMVLRGDWNIGIKHPTEPARAALVLGLNDQAIATSGNYERGPHIWGDHLVDLHSVSVVGPDLGTADALSTAVYSSGDFEGDWLDRFPDYEVAVITREQRILASPGIHRMVALA